MPRLTGILAARFAAILVFAVSLQARASDRELTIGVLTDLSSFAASSMGPGSVVATKLAVQDFGGTVLGKPIEVISADMQSRPDLAVTLAQHWYDVDGVDVIVDVPASSPKCPRSRPAGGTPPVPCGRMTLTARRCRPSATSAFGCLRCRLPRRCRTAG